MKKLFLAMMAVAAIAFVGCKPQNEPEGGKEEGGETKVTCTDVKLYYEVKFTGKMADYVKLNMRYVNIPDSNDILVKENIISDWTPEGYSVKQGVTAVYGLEPSLRASELFKQTFDDEAKHKTMVESNSTLVITMGHKSTFSDGRVDLWPACNYTFSLSEIPFDKSKKDAIINSLEKSANPVAYSFLWDNEDYLNSKPISNFWDRH